MEKEDIRLGRIAFEAYGAAMGWRVTRREANMPAFREAHELVQHAWIAAAKAVFDEAVKQREQPVWDNDNA